MPRPETSTQSFNGSHSATPSLPWIDSSITPRPLTFASRERIRSARSRAPSMSLAVEGEVPPPPVDRPVHQRRRARGRDQVQSQPEVDQIDKITTDENHRCLAEAAVSLVQALNGKIRAGLHRSGRRVGMESEVSAPRLVDQQRNPPIMTQLGHSVNVSPAAVLGWRDHDHGTDVSVASQGI